MISSRTKSKWNISCKPSCYVTNVTFINGFYTILFKNLSGLSCDLPILFVNFIFYFRKLRFQIFITMNRHKTIFYIWQYFTMFSFQLFWSNNYPLLNKKNHNNNSTDSAFFSTEDPEVKQFSSRISDFKLAAERELNGDVQPGKIFGGVDSVRTMTV